MRGSRSGTSRIALVSGVTLLVVAAVFAWRWRRRTPSPEPPALTPASTVAQAAPLPIPASSATTSATTKAEPKPKMPLPVLRGPLFAELDASFDRAGENAKCEGCHDAIAREWRASLHRDAYVDPSFTEAFALEPRAFCRNCHAPEADPKTPLLTATTQPTPVKLAGFGAEAGTSCVTCHSPRKGEAAAAYTKGPPNHPRLRAASLAGALLGDAACGDCHQFPFPDQAVRTKPEWMQLTLIEHEVSGASTAACISCHMPLVAEPSGKKHASHRFDASRDPAFVRSAARVEAAREGESVSFTITLGDVGHAFPTGDLLRRLAVVATVGDPAKPRVKRVKYLGRHFGDAQQLPGIIVRVVKSDDRIGVDGEGARVVRMVLPGSAASPVHWRVLYQRVQHLGGGEDHAKLSGEIVVDEGDLAP